jgi:hypothetical protein
MRNNQELMTDKIATILQEEYAKFKEVWQHLEEATTQATMLNTILSSWAMYFSTIYNKIKDQNIVISNLRTTRELTTDPKFKLARTNHIEKEKEVEVELSKQERDSIDGGAIFKRMEAQYWIDEWQLSSHHLQKMTPSIYQQHLRDFYSSLQSIQVLHHHIDKDSCFSTRRCHI